MERIEKIERALDQIGKGIKEMEALGAFSVTRKVEIAEKGTRMAYGAMREIVEVLKEIKTNGK